MNIKAPFIYVLFTSVLSTPALSEVTPEQLISSMSKKYINYCGNKKNKAYEKGNWNSVEECLTDGRAHLVYEHDQSGKPTKDYTHDLDHKRLVNAVKEGADIIITQVMPGTGANQPMSSRLNCMAIMVRNDLTWRGGKNKKEQVSCSSIERLSPFFNENYHNSIEHQTIISSSGHYIATSQITTDLIKNEYKITGGVHYLTNKNNKDIKYIKTIQWIVKY